MVAVASRGRKHHRHDTNLISESFFFHFLLSFNLTILLSSPLAPSDLTLPGKIDLSSTLLKGLSLPPTCSKRFLGSQLLSPLTAFLPKVHTGDFRDAAAPL